MSRPLRPARRWPHAEWWAPLLIDLAALQRSSAPVGMFVHDIDLGFDPPTVRVAWPGSAGTVRAVGPETGRERLAAALSPGGPVEPPVPGHDDEFWVPPEGAPHLLRYAWFLDQVGTGSDLWHSRASEPFRLLRITATEHSADVLTERTETEDVVSLRIPIKEGIELIGVADTIVENVWQADPARLTPMAPYRGLPVFHRVLPS